MSGPYGGLGLAEVAAVATPERVTDAIREVAGEHLAIGPLEVGPGGVARAQATKVLHEVTAQRDDTDGLVSYLAALDLRLDLDVLAAGRHHGFDVQLTVRLRLTAITASPEAGSTAVTATTYHDMTVTLKPRGLQARLLAKVGNVEHTIRHEAAGYIGQRLTRDDARATMLLPTTSQRSPT